MSSRDSWETPTHIFGALDNEFRFDIDVCATEDNTKCNAWIEEEDNALGLDNTWCSDTQGFHVDKATVWCNPPYSDVGPWIAKAVQEARVNNVTTVILTNYIIDCAYFQEHLHSIAEIRLALKRIQFEPPEGVKASSNSKPQMLTIITPDSAKSFGTPHITLWDNRRGEI